MIASFKNQATEDIYYGINTKIARRLLPQLLWNTAVKKLDQLDSATSINDLKVPPGNRLELLSGDREGEYSIRINDQYRICFKWNDTFPLDVEITDYH